ncbi:unnamed protein product, partial [Owenia fusiformis]
MRVSVIAGFFLIYLSIQDADGSWCTSQRQRVETYSELVSSSRPTKYYTGCGLFSLWRCTRLRYITIYSTQQRARTVTYSVRACCAGYKGSNCEIPICNCFNGGTCIRPNHCTCVTGYASPSCTDIDECSIRNGGCDHTCANTAGSYACSCRSGYRLHGKTCVDINECNNGNGGCAQICSNTIGTYTCSCNNGYYLSSTNRRSCIDVDECSLGTSRCDQGCVNTLGSYRCTCHAGYALHSNGYTCNDINECSQLNGGCSQLCINTQGSFRCDCNPGYDLNDQTCEDIDECSVSDQGCQHQCENTDGSYRCFCNTGYILDSNEKNCKDEDECSKDICDQHCSNTHGSYVCSCNTGYVLSSNGRTCSDVDECQVNNGGCDPDLMKCINLIGSFGCDCRKGYTLDDETSKTCINIDECAQGFDGCTGGCLNTPGGFNCTCDPGFSLESDGKTCADINECAQGTDGCMEGCLNTPGTFRCICNPGFLLEKDYKSCAETNECLINNGGCTHTCIDTYGSFVCSCPDGFLLGPDKLTCIDESTIVDACHPNPCKHGGICSLGDDDSFICACADSGFGGILCNRRILMANVVDDAFNSGQKSGSIQVRAKPENSLTITPTAPGLSFLPTSLELRNDVTVGYFEVKSISSGPKPIKFILSGSDADIFDVVDELQVFVKDVFSRLHLARKILPGGCFPLPLTTCPTVFNEEIGLSSTAEWYQLNSNSNVKFTLGITFVVINNFPLPIS